MYNSVYNDKVISLFNTMSKQYNINIIPINNNFDLTYSADLLIYNKHTKKSEFWLMRYRTSIYNDIAIRKTTPNSEFYRIKNNNTISTKYLYIYSTYEKVNAYIINIKDIQLNLINNNYYNYDNFITIPLKLLKYKKINN